MAIKTRKMNSARRRSMRLALFKSQHESCAQCFEFIKLDQCHFHLDDKGWSLLCRLCHNKFLKNGVHGG